MKAIRFLTHFYAVGGSGDSQVKYAAGQIYAADEETLRQVAAGIAEEVEVPDSTPVPVADLPPKTLPPA